MVLLVFVGGLLVVKKMIEECFNFFYVKFIVFLFVVLIKFSDVFY